MIFEVVSFFPYLGSKLRSNSQPILPKVGALALEEFNFFPWVFQEVVKPFGYELKFSTRRIQGPADCRPNLSAVETEIQTMVSEVFV